MRLIVVLFLQAPLLTSVSAKPEITGPQLSRIATVGQAVRLEVLARGDGVLTYQWRRNGRDIAGATKTVYQIDTAALSDRGFYEVLVGDASGEQVQSVFNLDVGPVTTRLIGWGANATGIPASMTNGLMIAKNSSVSCGFVLRSDGTVVGWGKDSAPELKIPEGLDSVVGLAARSNLAMAVRGDGSLVQWGDVQEGFQVPPVLKGVVAAAAGVSLHAALCSDGRVVAWGVRDYQPFLDCVFMTDIVAIAAGNQFIAGLRRDGKILIRYSSGSWSGLGAMDYGDVIAIAASEARVCALRRDGTLAAWGSPPAGGSSLVPDNLGLVSGVSLSGAASFAVLEGGAVRAWGYSDQNAIAAPPLLNGAYALGFCVALVEDRPPEVRVRQPSIVAEVGGFVSIQAEVSGTLPFTFVWKRNGVVVSDSGRIRGATTPVLIIDGLEEEDAGDYVLTCINPKGEAVSGSVSLQILVPPKITKRPLSRLVQIGQSFHATVEASSSGTIAYQWKHDGKTIEGVTGATLSIPAVVEADAGRYEVLLAGASASARTVFYLETTSLPLSSLEIVQVSNFSKQIVARQSGTGVVALAHGTNGAVALLGDGTVRRIGEIGTWTVPSDLSEVVAVAVGGSYCAALRADGTVRLFGQFSSYPGPVPDGLRDVVAVYASTRTVYALRADGGIVSWGGDSVPKGLTDVASLALGSTFAGALKKDGTVVFWGTDTKGADRVPSDIASGEVVALEAGYSHCVAMKRDGELRAWGGNDRGQSRVPLSVANARSVHAACDSSYVLRRDGTLLRWGGGGFDGDAIPNVVVANATYSDTVVLLAQGSESVLMPGTSVTVAERGILKLTTAFDSRLSGTIQWYKDGNALAGETRCTLLRSPAEAAHAGEYVARLTNGATAVASGSFAVAVPPMPALREGSPLVQLAAVGGSVRLEVPAPAGGGTVQWSKNGQPIAGGSQAALVLSPVTIADDGIYQAQVVTGSGQGYLRQHCVRVYSPESTVTRLWDEGSDPVPAGLKGVVEVASGEGFGLALKSDGTVVNWGKFTGSSVISMPTDLSSVVAVCATGSNAYALKANGTVVAWGAAGGGQALVRDNLADIVALFASRKRAYALRSDGQLFAIGAADTNPSFANPGPVMMATSFQDLWLVLMVDGSPAVVADYQSSMLYSLYNRSSGMRGLTSLAITSDNGFGLDRSGRIVSWGADSNGNTVVPDAMNPARQIAFKAGIGLALGKDLKLRTWGTASPPGGALRNIEGAIARLDSGVNQNLAVILSQPSAPRILSQTGTVVVQAGREAVLSVAVDGVPDPDFVWRKNGQVVADGGVVGGTKRSTLRISQVLPQDEGTYVVEVINREGTVTSQPMQIVLGGKIEASGKAVSGGSVSLTVSHPGATGYQWRLRGVAIPGATNAVLALNGLTQYDSGLYDVLATTADGQVSILPYALDVNPAQIPTGFALARSYSPVFVREGAGGIRAAVSLPDGSVLVGGDFTRLNGKACAYLARIRANGTLDEGFVAPRFTGPVHAIVADPDGSLYVGGDFGFVDGKRSGGVVRLTAALQVDATFDVGVGFAGPVFTLVRRPDGKLIVGGAMYSFRDAFVAPLVRLLGDGRLDTSFSYGLGSLPVSDNKTVRAMVALDDGRLLVGGEIPAAGAKKTEAFVYRVAETGSIQAGWSASGYGGVRAMDRQSDGTILAGFAGGDPTSESVIRLNGDCVRDLGWSFYPISPRMPKDISFIRVLPDGRWLLAGSDLPLMRFEASGMPDPTFEGTGNRTDEGHAFETLPDGSARLHGSYAAPAGGEPLTGWTTFRPEGGASPIRAGFAAARTAVLHEVRHGPGKTVYVRGDFTQVNGIPCKGLVRLTREGVVDGGFSAATAPDPSGAGAMEIQGDGKLLIYANGAIRRLLPDGSTDGAFAPVRSAGGGFLLQPDGRILYYDTTSSAGVGNAGVLLRASSSGVAEAAFNVPVKGSLTALYPQIGDRVLLGGGFTSIGGETVAAGTLFRLLADGTRDRRFTFGFQQMPVGFRAAHEGRVFVFAPGKASILLGADGSTEWQPPYPTVSCQVTRARVVGAVAPGLQSDSRTLATSLLKGYDLEIRNSFAMKTQGVDLWRTRIGQLLPEDDGSLLLLADGVDSEGLKRYSLMRLEAGVAAKIVTDAVSCTGMAGGTASFTVETVGSGPIRYQWYRNNTPIAGATNSRLELANLQPEALGEYFVLLENEFGSDMSSRVRLTSAVPAPLITQQPQPQSVIAGGTVTLNVQAQLVGTGGALKYQWRKQGFPIAGATSSTLVFAEATLSDAAFYEVAVSSGLESTVSDSVRLTVHPRRLLNHLVADPSFAPLIERWGGSVTEVLPGPAGSLLVSGAFTRIGGLSRPGLARINSEFAVDAGFSPPDALLYPKVFAVAGDGKVLVGVLRPNQPAGETGRSLVRLRADGTLDPDFKADPALGAVVSVSLQSDGTLIAIPGAPLGNRRSLYRLRADGSVDNAFAPLFQYYAPGIPGLTTIAPYLALPLSDGKILCRGPQSVLNGETADTWVTIDQAGRKSAGIGGPLPSSTQASLRVLPLDDGSALVWGGSMHDGNDTRLIVRMLAAGGVDPSFRFTSSVSSVNRLDKLGDGRVRIFYNAPGTGHTAAFLRMNGELEAPVSLGLEGLDVKASALVSPELVVAAGEHTGSEKAAKPVWGRTLVALKISGGQVSASELGTEILAGVRCAALAGSGKITIGGLFTRVGGLPASCVARINMDGSPDAAFNTSDGFDDAVQSLIVQPDGSVVTWGAYGSYRNTSVVPVVRLSAGGALDATITDSNLAGGPLVQLTRRRILAGGRYRLPSSGAWYEDVTIPEDALSAVETEGDCLAFVCYGYLNGPRTHYLKFVGPDNASLRTQVVDSAGALIRLDKSAFVSGTRTMLFNGNPILVPTVIHYLPNGSLDTKYDGAQIPAVPSGAIGKEVSRFHEPGYGCLLVNNWVGLYRLNENGALQTEFTVSPFTRIRASLAEEPRGLREVLVLDDGRLLLADDGFTVDGINRCGLMMLTATDAPVLQPLPHESSTINGKRWTLTASLSGSSGSVGSYQWYRNGSPIPGATEATLELTGPTSVDAGSYVVKVTGPGGIAQSGGTLLTIEPDRIAPAITSNPSPLTVGAGARVAFSVSASGTEPLVYAWEKDGVAIVEDARISGSRAASLTIDPAAPADGGLYRVKVTNAYGEAVSAAARLSVVPAGVAAAHMSPGWSAGESVTVTTVVTHNGEASRLAVAVLLPEGWSYVTGAGEPATKPKAGETGTLGWAFEPVPPSPVTFSYTLTVPAGQTGVKTIAGTATLTYGTNEPSLLIKPDPLILRSLRHHSADTDNDWKIGPAELLRALQLYETRKSGNRTGAYTLNEDTADGFAPDTTRGVQDAATLLRHHSGDADRDGRLSLAELTRMIQLYNAKVGPLRSGQYHARRAGEPESEDGFGPGP